MTNEEIAKIKAGVERLENYYTNVEWYVEALVTFLSTLEEQAKEVRNPIFDEFMSRVNPKVREEVRENIDRMLEYDSLIDEIKNFIEEYGYERGEDKLLIAIVARHFAKWGAENLKK